MHVLCVLISVTGKIYSRVVVNLQQRPTLNYKGKLWHLHKGHHQTKSINKSKKVGISFCSRGIKRQCIPIYLPCTCKNGKSKKYGGSRARLALKWQESTRKKYKTDIEEKGPDINLYGNRCIGYQLSRTIYLVPLCCVCILGPLDIV